MIDALVPIIVLPYLIGTIGINHFGQLSFSFALMTYFINVTQYGFSLSAVRDIARNTDKKAELDYTFSKFLFSKLFLLTFAVIIYSIISFTFFVYNKTDFLIYFFTLFYLIGDFLMPLWLFQGVQKMRFVTLTSSISKTILLISVFVFITSKEDFYLYPLLAGSAEIMSGLCGLLLAKYQIKVSLVKIEISVIIQTLKDSFSSFVTLFLPTLYSNTSVFLLGIFHGNHAVALLSGALKITNLSTTFNMILTRSFYPLLSSKSKTSKTANKIFIISGFLISVLIFLFAEILVNLFLGSEMTDSKYALYILSISSIFLAVRSAYGINNLLIKNLDKLYMRIAIYASIPGFVLSIFFTYYIGYVGGAIAIITAQGIYAFLTYYHSKKNA